METTVHLLGFSSGSELFRRLVTSGEPIKQNLKENCISKKKKEFPCCYPNKKKIDNLIYLFISLNNGLNVIIKRFKTLMFF
jgi:hypothetical protein